MLSASIRRCVHRLIGSVTSERDVLGQQFLGQSSVQLHSRTLELPRILILVQRGFIVNHAVSGRAFLERRKTIQQALQLSFGYIVPFVLCHDPFRSSPAAAPPSNLNVRFSFLALPSWFKSKVVLRTMLINIFPCASIVSWVLRWWLFSRDNAIPNTELITVVMFVEAIGDKM